MRGASIVVIAALLVASGARAQESGSGSGSDSGCPATARPIGPSQASYLDGQLGVPRRACMRTELALSGDGYLVARPADFYGNIRIGARLSGSYVIDDRVEIWASLELLRFQNIISAVSTAYTGLGYTSLGATLPLLREERRAIAAYARLVLPTTTGLDRAAQPLALELGGTAELDAHPNLRVHAWLSLVGSIALSQIAPADPRGGLRVGGGLDWVPYEALSFVLELASGFGYRDGLDFLAIQAAIRLALGDVMGVELSGTVPLAGAEVALASATLSLSARFDGR